MPTTIQAVETQVFANRCGDNILNRNLTFDEPFSANIVSGAGVANTSTDVVFSGKRSLYVNNLDSSDTLIINGGGINWHNDFTGSYILGTNAVQQFSVYNSNGVGTTITGRLNVYFDSYLIYIIEFSSTGTTSASWQTFYATLPFNSNFDYSFELDALPEGCECYLDGIKLEIDDKNSNVPTPYNTPFRELYLDAFSFDYNDLNTTTTPISYTTGDVVLTNDGLGAFTNLTQVPAGITLFNTSTNVFNFSDLSIGDVLMIRLDITVTTTSANQIFRTWLELGQGVAPYNITFHSSAHFKTVGTYSNLTVEMRVPIMNELTRDNPAQFKFNSDANATIKVNGWNATILRYI